MSNTMIEQMPKYESYKNSGVEWLGELPSHWSAKRLKFLLEERSERSLFGNEPLLMMSQKYGLVVRADFHDKSETSETNVNNKIVHKNDLVFNKLKAHLGVFYKSEIDFQGSVSPDYAVYKSRKRNEICDLKFLELLFRHPAYIQQFVVRATGIVEGLIRLYTSDLFDIHVPLPPVNEQKSILDFLAAKTLQINEVITIKQKQIELLKERKQIIIQQAVTQGLNPDAPMKDSNVVSIGQIPKHWKLMSLRYAFEFKNNMRVPLSAIDRGNMQGKYPYYGASGIIDYVDDYIFDEELILIAEDGANLLSKSTPLAFVASGKYWVNNHAHIIKPKFVGFKYWAELLSCLDYTIFISGAAQPKLTRDRLGSVKLPVPPEDEILEIVDFIESIIPPIDSEIELSTRQIEKLKEYKAVLINDAVTGKIKVTELA
ncbi:TPA: restriction endonuclease subunit S [Vibrio parahaemolyticus]|nr:restriction endonuclease subunit S [Vibrio parahaemolyticus]